MCGCWGLGRLDVKRGLELDFRDAEGYSIKFRGGSQIP